VSGGRRQWRWAFALAAAITLADVLTKEAVQAVFAYGERLPVTSFFNLVYVKNPGAAFSFLADADGWQRPILLGLGVVVAGVLAVMLVRNPMDRLTAFGFAAILGGAVGNVIDRARHGAVVDWLDLHLSGWHWPAFNIADIGVTGGAAALILGAMFFAPEKSSPEGARR
jgi:signal peptidase II